MSATSSYRHAIKAIISFWLTIDQKLPGRLKGPKMGNFLLPLRFQAWIGVYTIHTISLALCVCVCVSPCLIGFGLWVCASISCAVEVQFVSIQPVIVYQQTCHCSHTKITQVSCCSLLCVCVCTRCRHVAAIQL